MPDADELDSIFPGITDLLHREDWSTSPGSVLQRDPDHGGVTDESLAAYVNARMAQGRPALAPLATSGGGTATGVVASSPEPDPSIPDPGTGAGDEPGDGEEPEPGSPPSEPAPPSTEPEPAPAAPSEPPAEVPESLFISGRTFSRAELEAFARFAAELDRDPSLQSLLTSYYTGRINGLSTDAPAAPVAGSPLPAASAAPSSAQTPAPAGTGYPSLDDLDPAVAQLIEQNRALAARVDALAQSQRQLLDQTTSRTRDEAESLINRASRSFADEHNLTPEELTRLRSSAGRLGHIDVLMSGIDPITNVPVRPDLLSATERALEIAMWADPQLRQREIDRALEVQRSRTRHRQKLAGIGGSGGSVSRTPVSVSPGTPEAKRAMTEEVAAMMSGTWSEPGQS